MKLVVNNSFHVLGLDSAATQKQVRTRVVEMGNLLKIEEVPSYDWDLVAPETIRSIESVKEAQSTATSPERHLKDYFFWFDIGDDVDQRAFTALRSADFDVAMKGWEEAISQQPNNASRRRNLGLAYLFILGKTNRSELLARVVGFWNETIQSDFFWNSFQKIYSHSDDLGTDPSAFATFRSSIRSELISCFVELYELHGHFDYLAICLKTFGTDSEALKRIVVAPLVAKIESCAVELSVIGDDKNTKGEEFDRRFEPVAKQVQVHLERANQLGVFSEASFSKVRDRVAIALRSISITLHNDDDYERAAKAIEMASQIAATSGVASMIQQDSDTVRSSQLIDIVVAPIKKMVEKKDYRNALTSIMTHITSDDQNMVEILTIFRRTCVANILTADFASAKELFDNSREAASKEKFDKIIEFVNNHLDIFNINRENLNKLVARLRDGASNINAESLAWFDERRQKNRDIAAEAFKSDENTLDRVVFVFLLDSYIFSFVAPKMKVVMVKAKASNFIRNVIANIIMFAIFAALAKACQ